MRRGGSRGQRAIWASVGAAGLLTAALGAVVVTTAPPAGATPNTTIRASVDTTNGDVNGDSTAGDGVSVSADGRYVAFESDAKDLVANDTDNNTDVFVRDLINGTTTRASVDTDNQDANGPSSTPRLSADGRYVAFASDASDLVETDGN